MLLQCALLLALVGCTHQQAPLPDTYIPIDGAFVKPTFCHDLDCPVYSVVEKTDV